MIEKELDLKESELLYQDFLNNNSEFGFYNLDEEYMSLRKDLINLWDEAKSKVKKVNSYEFDLEFGIRIYPVFLNKFSNITLSSYDFWRFISLCVIPDLLYERWGNSPLHYYKKTVRIYPFTLFWYIKLSWQGSLESTYSLLNKKYLTTDTILQIVERPGRMGVYVEYYNALIKKFCNLPESKNLQYGDILRNVLTLNTARSFNISIDYYEGGLIGYVNDLFANVLGGNVNG